MWRNKNEGLSNSFLGPNFLSHFSSHLPHFITSHKSFLTQFKQNLDFVLNVYLEGAEQRLSMTLGIQTPGHLITLAGGGWVGLGRGRLTRKNNLYLLKSDCFYWKSLAIVLFVATPLQGISSYFHRSFSPISSPCGGLLPCGTI